MIEALPADGWAVLNEDDPLVKKQKLRTKAKIITFGSGKNAHVKLVKSNWTSQGTEFVFKAHNDYSSTHPKLLSIKLVGYLLPKHYGLTLGAAGAVGLTQSIPLTTSLQRIQTHFSLPPSRASLFSGINGSTILDSSYNSSPLALHDFFDMLQDIKHFSRLIALLGDMRELGQATQQEHEQAALVASRIFDQVFLIGPAMTNFATPIFSKHHIPTQTFTNPWQAIPALQSTLQPGDLLFVKGSQNTILLETTIEPLLANPTDRQYLCRRGKFWENQREKLKLVNLYTNGTVSDTSF